MSSIKPSELQNRYNNFTAEVKSGTKGSAHLKEQASSIWHDVDKMSKDGTIASGAADKIKENLQKMEETVGAQNPAEMNKAMDELDTLVKESTGRTANKSGDLVVNGQVVPSAVADVARLYGDGSTTFAKTLSSYGVDVMDLNGSPKTPTELTKEMANKGIRLYTDDTGNAILFQDSTRRGAGFNGEGGDVKTKDALNQGSQNVASAYDFQVGKLKATFGTMDDSNGNKFGIKVDQ